MSKLLYSQSTQQTFGYPRGDDEPVIGLDPDFLVLTRVETDPPEITENQSLSSIFVVDIPSLEYRQQWTVVDNPSVPNWDGLYTNLLGSGVYQFLVGLSLQFTAVDSALDKVIAAVNYGDKNPDSEVAFDAFQSAINLLLYALGLVGQLLSAEQLAEVRGALDGNGFAGINLE